MKIFYLLTSLLIIFSLLFIGCSTNNTTYETKTKKDAYNNSSDNWKIQGDGITTSAIIDYTSNHKKNDTIKTRR